METKSFFVGNALSSDGIVALRGCLFKSLTALYNSVPHLNTKTIFLTGYTRRDTHQRVEAYGKHLNATNFVRNLKLLFQ